jgi:hypothetical protein
MSLKKKIGVEKNDHFFQHPAQSISSQSQPAEIN